MIEKNRNIRMKFGIYIAAVGICLVSSTGCQPNQPLSDTIGEESALTSALSHAQLDQDDITNLFIGLDKENGSMVYDIDFTCNGYEYDYDVDAVTGKVIKHEKELDNYSVPSQEPIAGNPSSSSIFPSVSDAGYIGEQKAKSAAFSHAGIAENSIYNYKYKLDYDNGIPHYEIDFDCNGYEYEYEIDAADGSVLKYQKEKDDNISSLQTNTNNSSNTYIGETEAKKIALSHAGAAESGIRKYKCELDYDNGYTYYEIEFEAGNYKYEYEIDAYNGTILKNEKDWD